MSVEVLSPAGPAARTRAVQARLLSISAVVVLVCLGVMVYPLFANVLPAALLNALLFVAVHKRLRPSFLSPATIFAAYLTLIGVSSFFLVNKIVGSGGTSGIDFVMTDDLLVQTANLFLLASVAVLAGAWIARGPSGAGYASVSSILDFGDLSRYRGVILGAATVDLVLAVILSGVGNLISRPTYLFASGAGFTGTLVQMLSLAAIAGLGLVLFGTKGSPRILAFLLLSAFILYFVALGTRRLGLIPVLLLLSFVIARRGSVRIWPVVLAMVAAVTGLAITLHFRGLEMHGLVPHLAGISEFRLGTEELNKNLNNVLVGFRITALTAFEQPLISPEIFAISISPFSGTSLGWAEVSRILRLNAYTPYSAVGEIANRGVLFAAITFLVIGAIFGFIERNNSKLFTSSSSRLLGLVTVGLIFLFVVQSIQYNLRSITRYVFLALAVQLVAMLILKSTQKRK